MTELEMVRFMEKTLAGEDGFRVIEHSYEEKPYTRLFMNGIVLTLFPENCKQRNVIVRPKKCNLTIQYNGHFVGSLRMDHIPKESEDDPIFQSYFSQILSSIQKYIDTIDEKGIKAAQKPAGNPNKFSETQIQVFVDDDDDFSRYEQSQYRASVVSAGSSYRKLDFTSGYFPTGKISYGENYADAGNLFGNLVPHSSTEAVENIARIGYNVTPFLNSTWYEVEDEDSKMAMGHELYEICTSNMYIPRALCENLSLQEVLTLAKAVKGGFSLMALNSREDIAELASTMKFAEGDKLCLRLGLSKLNKPTDMRKFIENKFAGSLPPFMTEFIRTAQLEGENHDTVRHIGLSDAQRREIRSHFFSDEEISILVDQTSQINGFMLTADGRIAFFSNGMVCIDGNSVFYIESKSIKWRVIKLNVGGEVRYVKYGPHFGGI